MKKEEKEPYTLYLRQVSRFKSLSLKEKQELSKEIINLREKFNAFDRNNPERESVIDALCDCKNKIINSYLSMVISIAKRYQNRGLSLSDLIDEGNEGLYEAVEHINYQKDRHFTTYITMLAKKAIMKAISEKENI